ncbi:hypothetical protein OH805_20555 [Streptomyces sp. NBC_00879]|uniref:hypothetical protein n=1 Tax=unclassified Streptomyces TaxID=2593676 RepID=UPI0038635B20|nr:hypothetical protein OHA61_21465 [Streptomyces sp. NBC_00885]WSY76343.1 hypothetical protein OH805_20555 [Streptomyces sp. NBC_00879]
MAISRARTALFTGLIGAITAVAGITMFGVANASPQAAEPASASEMPSAVEDFSYPGAAQIQKDQKILLKRGDGHITLVSCDGTPDITVKSRTGQKTYCFDVSAKQGYLSLELPDAFGIWTEVYPVKATITAGGKETVVNAAANDYKPFGEAGTSDQRSVLVELRVTS